MLLFALLGSAKADEVTFTFNPASGSEVEENTPITITCSDASKAFEFCMVANAEEADAIKNGEYGWMLANKKPYSEENKPVVTKEKPYILVGYSTGMFGPTIFGEASYIIKGAEEGEEPTTPITLTFDPASGSDVAENTSVTITCNVPGTTITYVTGDQASAEGVKGSWWEYVAKTYSEDNKPVIKEGETYLLASYMEGGTRQYVAASYTIKATPTPITITFSPASGAEVEENTPVTITCSNTELELKYVMLENEGQATMYKSMWSMISSYASIYSEANKPTVTSENPYLLVRYEEDGTEKWAEASYTIKSQGGKEKVATPTIEPGEGRYQKSSYITIECTTPGAKIWYKKGTEAWKEYERPTKTYIDACGEVTFQAYAEKDGMANSDTVSITYLSTVKNPRIELIAGEIHIKTSVSAGYTIHYQINSGDWKDTTKDIRFVYDTCYTITAYATDNTCPNSDTITVVYNAPKVDNPNFSAKHAVLANTPVTLSTKNTAAEIYYAKDASESWTKYTEPIVITENCLIRAYAAKEGLLNSDTMAIRYRIVTFTPAPGEVEDNTSVSISCAAYTADESISFAYKLYADKATAGQDQSFFTTKTTYSENQKPVITASSLFLRCEVTINDQTSTYAPYVDAVYAIKKDIPMPIITPAGGEVEKGTEVEIKLAEGVAEGVKILYTVNDSLPVAGKDYTLEYTQKIVVNEAMTIKAMAFKAKTGDEEHDLVSNVAEASFTVKETPVVADTVKVPTFNPAAGEVAKDTKVAIACATEGAKIYYTVDGSVPTAESTEYTAEITIDKDMTVKAIAVKEGMVNSKVAEAAYTVKETANEGKELAGVHIYPNPSDGAFKVEVPVAAEVEIINTSGVVVKHATVAAGVTALRLENSGLYFVRFTANGQVAIKKLVVR